mgnify:FL=1
MKVLFPLDGGQNPFVEELAYGLRQHGVEVVVSSRRFWERKEFDFDIVHFQWAESLFHWKIPTYPEILYFQRRIEELRNQCSIFYTRHNRQTHVSDPIFQVAIREIERLLLENVHAVHHLGWKSYKETLPWFPKERYKHFVIPHHTYDSMYKDLRSESQKVARRKVGLPLHKKVILAFGAFRCEGERTLVRNAIRDCKNRKAIVFAPLWKTPRFHGFQFRKPRRLILSVIRSANCYRDRIRIRNWKGLSPEWVASCFNASDVILLQRQRALNSGNLPMGFQFGKVVVGTNDGVIGEILGETGNPYFSPEVRASVAKAVEAGLRLCSEGKGRDNLEHAEKEWSLRKVSGEILKAYELARFRRE